MEYLLFLQNLRDAVPQWVNESILFFSEFVGGAGGLALMALVYWCVNKRTGTLLMMHYSLAYVCNGFVKNAFRVERPFHRDTRLTPYSPVTGYSFPSGHTMLATAFYGGLAVRQRKRKRLAVCFCLLALLTGFTRNWLGAHTLEDVLVGIVLSCGLIALNGFLLERIDQNPRLDRFLLAAALLICAVFCFAFPAGAKPAGIYGGVMLGWFLERRFIRFEIWGSRLQRAGLYVSGALVVGVCYKLLLPGLLAPLGGSWAGTINHFITFLLITAGWPAVIRFLGRKRGQEGSACE